MCHPLWVLYADARLCLSIFNAPDVYLRTLKNHADDRVRNQSATCAARAGTPAALSAPGTAGDALNPSSFAGACCTAVVATATAASAARAPAL